MEPPAAIAAIECPENRLAFAALRRLERSLAKSARPPFHPLLIVGASGGGKSILVSTFVHRVLNLGSVCTVRVVPAHDLTPGPDGTPGDVDFDDLEDPDLLILEDVQQLAKSAVSPLCRVLEHRGRLRRATVITANAAPNRMPHLTQRLLSRLTAGLVTALEPYGVESRELILRRTTDHKHLQLTKDALHWLATQSAGSLRPALGQLDLLKSLTRGRPGVLALEDVKAILDPAAPPTDEAALDRIVQRVATHFHVTPKAMIGPSRLRGVLLARQVAMTLARDVAKLTLPRIGDYFAGRDHSTVLHAVRKVNLLCHADRSFARTVRDLKTQC